MTFDPRLWLQAICIRPTRGQLTQAGRKTEQLQQLKRKLQIGMEMNAFVTPSKPYHATVVIEGVKDHEEGLAMQSAICVLMDAPMGFDTALSHTFHLVKNNRQPLIGLLASEEPLDRCSAIAQFVARGDEGR